MILKILKKDLMRKKIITAAVFIFIMLSSMLMASGSNMIINLLNSIDYLFETSSAPHFTQSHTGEFDQNLIDEWSLENELIEKRQTVEMINISGSNLYLNSELPEDYSFMDNGFVKQNKEFDFLLNLNNEVIKVEQGEIAVPIHYMQNKDLRLGDTIVIKKNDKEISFTITNFVRDVLMNPAIISSKRFVVNEADFNTLKNNFGDSEYLISFKLNDINDLKEFRNQYSQSNLPQKGPTIDIQLLRLMHSLSDGLIAAVIILISILLCIISLLCLRFVILLTLEEDYREIGVMKAIGILPAKIRNIYLSKYLILAVTASFTGYLLSLFVNHLFIENIMLYIGKAPLSIFELLIPAAASLLIALIVILFSLLVLKRFKKVSAVEAIRMGSTGGIYSNNKKLALHKNKKINSNIFLGLRDVLLRFKTYIILFLVFVLSTFIIIVPLNFLNTIQSPKFISYMGVGESDLILDIRSSNQMQKQFEEVINYIENDSDVTKFASYITGKYEIVNQEGTTESLFVTTGNFDVFPIDYVNGIAPSESNEMALSYLSASEFEKSVGDPLILIANDIRHEMVVSGIYQDITNGGKTAKAKITPDYDKVVWYNINLNVNTDIPSKVQEYNTTFDNLKVTDIEGYIDQTFSVIIDQLQLLTVTAIIIAVLITILITVLFLKMLTAKDMSQIAIMKSIGISLRDIKIQYITRALIVLNLGIIVGTVLSNTLGERILSLLLSVMGAKNIQFIINPLVAYILSPLFLILIVTITTLLSINNIEDYSIEDINVE
jgi:putative ABC transport system permease protein